MDKTTRNATVDLARGIGIILIALGHNRLLLEDQGEAFRIVYSFHVPLFFFLTGLYLRDTDRLAASLVTRFHSLLKPYFVVLLTAALLRWAVLMIPGRQDLTLRDHVIGLFWGSGGDWTPLWFLPHIFLAVLSATALLHLVRRWYWRRPVTAVVAVVLLVAGIVAIRAFEQSRLAMGLPLAWNNPKGLPWSMDLLPMSVACILAGHLLSRQVQMLQASWFKGLVALALFAGLHFFFDEFMDLNLRVYGVPWISTTQAAAGIYLTLMLAASLQTLGKWAAPLAYVGSGSLFILLFHAFVQGKAFNVIFRISPTLLLPGFISLIAAVVLPLAFWELSKRSGILSALLLPRPRKIASAPDQFQAGKA